MENNHYTVNIILALEANRWEKCNSELLAMIFGVKQSGMIQELAFSIKFNNFRWFFYTSVQEAQT